MEFIKGRGAVHMAAVKPTIDAHGISHADAKCGRVVHGTSGMAIPMQIECEECIAAMQEMGMYVE